MTGEEFKTSPYNAVADLGTGEQDSRMCWWAARAILTLIILGNWHIGAPPVDGSGGLKLQKLVHPPTPTPAPLSTIRVTDLTPAKVPKLATLQKVTAYRFSHHRGAVENKVSKSETPGPPCVKG